MQTRWIDFVIQVTCRNLFQSLLNLFSSRGFTQKKKQNCCIHHHRQENSEVAEAAAENNLYPAENTEHKNRTLGLFSVLIKGSYNGYHTMTGLIHKRLFPDIMRFDPAYQRTIRNQHDKKSAENTRCCHQAPPRICFISIRATINVVSVEIPERMDTAVGKLHADSNDTNRSHDNQNCCSCRNFCVPPVKKVKVDFFIFSIPSRLKCKQNQADQSSDCASSDHHKKELHFGQPLAVNLTVL